jgi:alpha-mannosidase
MKQRNPDLYERMRKAIKSGQWVLVGGTWIEPDCNIPSGEALCRQFLFGQRYFQREFGVRCKEFWNPDVFGYNGQLPQIMQLAGITRFPHTEALVESLQQAAASYVHLARH